MAAFGMWTVQRMPVFCLLLASTASAARMQADVGEHEALERKSPRVDFPDALKDIFKHPSESGPPRFLGSSATGEAWHAVGAEGSDLAGQEVIVKLMYTEASAGRFEHVSPATLAARRELKAQVERAVGECEAARDLQRQALTMGSLALYASRFVNCLSHNYDDTADEYDTHFHDPIYVVIEYAGETDLYTFANQRALTPMEVAVFTKQITEGLEYLANLETPVIHHDLTPKNCIIREVPGMTHPILKMANFLTMFEAGDDDSRCELRTTLEYAPPEHFRGYLFQPPASSYDMFSLGNILAFMVMGRTFGSIWPSLDGSYSVTQAFKDYPSFKKLQFSEVEVQEATSRLELFLQDPQAPEFVQGFLMRMVAEDPGTRPSPLEVLESSLLSNVPSLMDPGWKMVDPEKVELGDVAPAGGLESVTEGPVAPDSAGTGATTPQPGSPDNLDQDLVPEAADHGTTPVPEAADHITPAPRTPFASRVPRLRMRISLDAESAGQGLGGGVLAKTARLPVLPRWAPGKNGEPPEGLSRSLSFGSSSPLVIDSERRLTGCLPVCDFCYVDLEEKQKGKSRFFMVCSIRSKKVAHLASTKIPDIVNTGPFGEYCRSYHRPKLTHTQTDEQQSHMFVWHCRHVGVELLMEWQAWVKKIDLLKQSQKSVKI